MKHTWKKGFALLLAVLLTVALVSCGKTDKNSGKLKVGASPAPHAAILEFITPILAEEGIELEIVEFTDYVRPNTALEEKSLDANFFQHLPYLENFNKEQKTNLVSAVAVHFEPMGIYSSKHTSLDEVKQGGKIGVPNDTTNEARALQLLEVNGIIKLNSEAGLEATVKDIVENPYNVEIVELAAEQLPRALPDVDFAVINGNYALDGGVLDSLLVTESPESDAAQTFANILAVRAGDESREDIQKLVKVLTSEEVRVFINDSYKGSAIAVF